MTTPQIIPSLDNHDNPGNTTVIRGVMVEYSSNSLHIYVQYIPAICVALLIDLELK